MMKILLIGNLLQVVAAIRLGSRTPRHSEVSDVRVGLPTDELGGWAGWAAEAEAFYKAKADMTLAQAAGSFGYARTLEEYSMPFASSEASTHNMATNPVLPGKTDSNYEYPDALFITMQPTSQLVKMQLNTSTGKPIATAWETIGEPTSGLHGLAASAVFPGEFWATLQFEGRIIRFKPSTRADGGQTNVWKPVTVTADHRVTEVFKDPTVSGPHELVEYLDENGDAELWVTLRDSHHVGQIKFAATSGSIVSSNVVAALAHPIFVVRPGMGGAAGKEFPKCASRKYAYAAQDGTSDRVLRIDVANGWTTEQISIHPQEDGVEVGNVVTVKEGPDCSVWFGALNGVGGNLFKIDKTGELSHFTLTSPLASGAGFINLQWVRSAVLAETTTEDRAALEPPNSIAVEGQPVLLLLASSLTNTNGNGGIADGKIDAMVQVAFNEETSEITAENTFALPTQPAASHRILQVGPDVWISTFEGTVTRVVAPGRRAGNEISDYFALFGRSRPKGFPKHL